MSSGNWTDAPAGVKAGLIGMRLVRLRGNRKQQDIAQAAGMDQPQLSRYERGKAIPSNEVISRLATALKCSEKEILEPLTFEEGKVFLSNLEPAKQMAKAFGAGVASKMADSTPGQVHRKTKIPTEIVEKILRGEMTPTKWVVEKLSEHFDCDPDDLFPLYVDNDIYFDVISISSDFEGIDLKGEVWEAFQSMTKSLESKIFALVHRTEALLDELKLLKLENTELRNELKKLNNK